MTQLLCEPRHETVALDVVLSRRIDAAQVPEIGRILHRQVRIALVDVLPSQKRQLHQKTVHAVLQCCRENDVNFRHQLVLLILLLSFRD